MKEEGTKSIQRGEVICRANLIKENKNLRKYSFVNTNILKLCLLRKKKKPKELHRYGFGGFLVILKSFLI